MDKTTGLINTPEDEIDEDLNLGQEQNSLEEKRCPICGDIKTKKILIECGRCHSQYHITCVKISKLQAKQIPLYICPPCRNVAIPNNEPLRANN